MAQTWCGCATAAADRASVVHAWAAPPLPRSLLPAGRRPPHTVMYLLSFVMAATRSRNAVLSRSLAWKWCEENQLSRADVYAGQRLSCHRRKAAVAAGLARARRSTRSARAHTRPHPLPLGAHRRRKGKHGRAAAVHTASPTAPSRMQPPINPRVGTYQPVLRLFHSVHGHNLREGSACETHKRAQARARAFGLVPWDRRAVGGRVGQAAHAPPTCWPMGRPLRATPAGEASAGKTPARKACALTRVRSRALERTRVL